MSEAISYYTRTKEEKNEDSGIESGNSLENNGKTHFWREDEKTGHCFQAQIVKERAVLNIRVKRRQAFEIIRQGLATRLCEKRRNCWSAACELLIMIKVNFSLR